MSAERTRPALRAIRREPMLVDDRLAADRLREVDPSIGDDTARWARAWLVCWFASLASDETYGRVDPWEIPIRLDAVTVPKGGGDGVRPRVVLDALVRAGLAAVTHAPDGRRGALIAQLSREAFAEHPAALGVDWASVVARCGAEPAALLVMRALAELVVPLDAWSAVPRRDLVDRTGYQQKQVRVALRRLVAADLLSAEGDAGTTARYRLTPRALGRRWAEETPTAPAPVSVPAPATTATAPAATGSVVADGDGVQLVIGGASVTLAPGARFEIGPGVAARLEIGSDGRLRMVVQPPER